MKTEFEAKFLIDISKFQEKLKLFNARLVRANGLMRRYNFKVVGFADQWLRVRDEGDYVTLTLKSYDQSKGIASLSELEVVVSDFDTTVAMLQNLGYQRLIYAENYREIWAIDDCLLMIDQWPALDPIVEIEGPSEQSVHNVAKLLDFNMDHAMYGTSSLLYQKKYGINRQMFDQITELTFEKLPFWAQKTR